MQRGLKKMMFSDTNKTHFEEIGSVGTLCTDGCQPINDTNDEPGFYVGAGYSDNCNAVILECFSGLNCLHYHLSVYQAKALANLILQAATNIQLCDSVD